MNGIRKKMKTVKERRAENMKERTKERKSDKERKGNYKAIKKNAKSRE